MAAAFAQAALDSIDQAAEELLRRVLATPVGAATVAAAAASQTDPQAQGTPRPMRPSEQHSFLEWLSQQRLEYEAARRVMQQRQEPDAAATAGKSEEEEEAELLDRLENAQRQLAQVSAERQREQLLIDALHNSALAADAVYETSDDPKAAARIRALLEARDQLSTRFLQEREKLKEMEQELDNLRKRNRSLRNENRDLTTQVQRLHADKEAKASQVEATPAMQKAQQELERELVRNTILRNIFQLLIVGSGIDWSEDDALRERLLSLGEPSPAVQS